MKVLVIVAAMLSTAFVLVAQSDADYQGWMKSVVGANGKLQKGIAAKDSAVAAEATTIETAFKQIEAFWTKRSAADAAALAKQGHMAAAAAGKAINMGDWEKAAAEGKNIGGTCATCHMAHRGGEKGAYTIK
jgi:cytochrome c556